MVSEYFRTEEINLFKSLLTKTACAKIGVRRQAKQKLEEIGFYFNISATRI